MEHIDPVDPGTDDSRRRPGGPDSTVGQDTRHQPSRVRAGRGRNWITDAWSLVRDQPWHWIIAALSLTLTVNALERVPWLMLVSVYLAPVLYGGLIIGAHTQYHGGRFKIMHLFAASIREHPGVHAVGLIAVALCVITRGVSQVVVYAISGSADWSLLFAAADEQTGLIDLLVSSPFELLLGIPATMAIYFAPPLVALDRVPVLRALKLSFVGCLRNILAFLVFGLNLVFIALGLLLATIFLGLAFGQYGVLLILELAALVLVPVFVVSNYIAYRDIYYR